MKKIMSLMLGAALVFGTAAFADEKKPAEKTTETKKKSKKAPKEGEAKKEVKK
jgi:hypothetical protein